MQNFQIIKIWIGSNHICEAETMEWFLNEKWGGSHTMQVWGKVWTVETELCSTGLTDKMRADFTIMKDLSGHTKLTPAQREERLNKFVMNIQK